MKAKQKKMVTLRAKLVLLFVCTFGMLLFVNTFLYIKLNSTIHAIDRVYVSNVRLNHLSEALSKVQDSVYQYLNTKSSESLKAYYSSEEEYKNLLDGLSDEISDNEFSLMEKDIKEMSQSYLSIAADTVNAKRGRNIEKYRETYQESSALYSYIKEYINSLNEIQFQSNSDNYNRLRLALQYMEITMTIILLFVISFDTLTTILVAGRITRPLIELSKTADEVAKGNFSVARIEVNTGDEVEVLSKAFDQMVVSLKQYIQCLEVSMKAENEMKEKELIMQNHLKDAQLKYLQAQINPHFLFNTLNAAAQLSVLEGGEKTSIFIQTVAEFFRYSMRCMERDATLKEEIQLVDYYVYIMQVRFSGEIQFEKRVEEELLSIRVPSMILQPIVENAFHYGIRDIERKGQIDLQIYKEQSFINIAVSDNGMGMEQERIRQVMEGEVNAEGNNQSNGVGLKNVRSRLELYYNNQCSFQIYSNGLQQGTKVTLRIPLEIAV